MPEIVFVTGTDTDVGKTVITGALLRAAREAGVRSLGLKPVAAGCEVVDGQLRNDDALALISACGTSLAYDEINPVAVEEAIAPHIALARANRTVKVAELAAHCRSAITPDDQLVLVEGAGGWFVPLNDTETLAELAVALEARVVLVIGMKLGCLNHAFLTVAAIRSAGLTLAGWIANCATETMPFLTDNLASLELRLDAPCLGQVPQLADPLDAIRHVDVAPLLRPLT